MKIKRTIEDSGLVVTHFGGKHTYDDAIDALHELEEIHKGRNDLYEIVINADDIETHISMEQEPLLREAMKKLFQRFDKGAIAFVSNNDLMFGICRQLEVLFSDEKIAISAFRSEENARKWIDQIRSLNDDEGTPLPAKSS